MCRVKIGRAVSRLCHSTVRATAQRRTFFRRLLTKVIGRLLKLVFVIDRGHRLSSASRVPSFIRETHDCVRRIVRRGIDVPRVTYRLNVDCTAFHRAFGGCAKLSPTRCFVGLHLRQTGRLLHDASVPVGRVSCHLRFRGPRCFTALFGGHAKLHPSAFHG